MTTLGPDHFNRRRKPKEVQILSNSSFNRSNRVTLAVKQGTVL